MIVAENMQKRDAVDDAVLSVSNGDGTWTVYQPEDEIPAAYQYAISDPAE